MKNLSLSFQYTNTYDNNILRYSDRDRDRFLDGNEVHPSPVNSLDDLRMDYRIISKYRWYLPGRERGEFRFDYQHAQYYRNPVKNSSLLSITLKQGFLDKWYALVNYVHVPRFYLRVYTDVHTKERVGCKYALDKTVSKLSWRPVKALELISRFEYKKYAYSKYFTEYDGDLTGIGAETVLRTGDWRLSCRYNFYDFENIGFSSSELLPPGDYGEDSKTGEGDYQEDEYSISVQYSFRLVERRFRTRISQTISNRYYSTDRSPDIDPIHHGRNDVSLATTLTSTVNLTGSVDVTLGVNFKNRDSDASNSVVSRVKDYSAWSGWIELTYDLF